MKKVSLCATGVAMLFLFMAVAAFGDEGENSWLKNTDVEVSATSVLQGSPGLTGSDSVVGASLAFDLKVKTKLSKSGTAFMQFKDGYGNEEDGIDEVIPTFSLFNTATSKREFRLGKIWYEHAFGDKARLRVGKIDMTTDFDANEAANDEDDQFLSEIFVNNLALEFPDGNSFGTMLWISPNEFFDIGIGFADAHDKWDDVFKSPFTILEIGFKPVIADRQGNYRFYGWHNGKDHERLLSDEIGDDENYGFGLSADQEISEDVTLFARYGHQRGSVSELEHTWSFGVGISGRFLGREEDTLGLAYGQAVIGKDWKSFDPENFDNEHRMEIYYRIKTNNYLSLTPNLQWVKNTYGVKDSNAWVFGLRANLHLHN